MLTITKVYVTQKFSYKYNENHSCYSNMTLDERRRYHNNLSNEWKMWSQRFYRLCNSLANTCVFCIMLIVYENVSENLRPIAQNDDMNYKKCTILKRPMENVSKRNILRIESDFLWQTFNRLFLKKICINLSYEPVLVYNMQIYYT